MALRIWLPLNGNLNNQGLNGYTYVFNGTYTVEAGKIGQCYKHLNASITNLNGLKDAPMTICFWAKTSDASSSWQKIIMFDNENASQIHGIYVADSARIKYEYSPSLNVTAAPTEWHHYAFVINDKNSQAYYDGVLATTSNEAVSITTLGKIRIAEGAGIYLNDVRIYDECLSPKQIKEISKGLVCHYKLDNRFNTKNLFINGFGELGGNIGWNNSNVSTTEVPSGVANVKASFYNGNSTKNDTPCRVPIISTHSYTISAYIKSSGATSGSVYPSIFPYDVDKKFIQHHSCKAGFWTNTVTTLTQALNPGDTVIHAADLSKWDTGDNYGYHIAIFGYADSTGYIYPDLEYTQDTPVFGTKTDKSHVDKTNNTITLNAAYSGAARAVGTKICQSTEGSTYYYPFGQLQLANLSDWTFKTATIIPINENRLRWSKYWTYGTYNNTYHAALSLVDNNWMDSTKVIDCSGYDNNLIQVDGYNYDLDSPRHSYSAKMVGTSNNRFYKAGFNLNNTSTLSCWVKPTEISGSGTQWLIYVGEGSGGWADIQHGIYINGTGITAGGNGVSATKNMSWNSSSWYFLTTTKENGIIKLYVNGELQGTSSTGSDITKTVLTLCNRSGNATGTTSGSYPFKGSISDVRIYSTALSADDILTMYKNSGIIDNKGNVYAYEFKEE